MLKLIKKLEKRELFFILFSVVAVAFQVYLDLQIPDYMSEMTTSLQSGGTVNEILNPGIKMLLCALTAFLTAVLVGYFAACISAGFVKVTRKRLFKKVESFNMEEIKKFKTSSLITRTTNDVANIRMFISMGLQMLIKAPIMAIWAIIKISNKSFEFSLVTIIAVILLLILIVTLIVFVIPKFKIMQKLTDNLNDVTRENLIGIRVVRAFNAENYQEQKFEKANKELMETSMFTQKMMNIMSPFMSLIMQGITLSIYIIGAILINQANVMDKITLFSDMIVFSTYAMNIVISFLLLSFVFIMYPRASVSSKRVLEVLETDISIKEGNYDKETKEKGLIEFKNVSFKYPDAKEYLLENINFKATKGEVVAIIGRTGCGKSTLVNLLPRFYDVTEGEILLDNINIKEYKEETLNNKIGYISQKPIIFTGSVKHNVSYGKNINDKDINKALEVAQADFVFNLEDGINYDISRGGTNISGGQKQRISIARAIAKKPEIYIFDDSFSALDYKTDYNLRKALKEYTKDSTVIIVAQRIGTIKNADKIIVLEEGKCVGMGTHKELIKTCDVYKDIALSQITKEELENA